MTDFVPQHLTERARIAEPGVTEVTDDEGRRALVDREPGSPGTFRVTLLDAQGRETGARSWEVESLPERPGVYPSELPFIPDLECTISVAGPGRAIVVWAPSGRPVVPDQSRSILAGNETFKEVARGLEEARRGEEGGAGRKKVQQLLEEAVRDPGVLEALARAGVPPDPDALRAHEEAFGGLVEESRSAGWSEVEGAEGESVFSQKTVSFEKDGRLRRITLATVLGSSSLTLFQGESA